MTVSTTQPRESRIVAAVTSIGAIVALLWALEVIDWLVFEGGLDRYGIVPRELDGLLGVLAAPFLHGGFGHLAANTGPLVVLGMLVFVRGAQDFATGTVLIALLGGLGVWLLGSIGAATPTVHIGASGVIFGYLGLLLAVGLFERSLGSLLLSVLVGVAYGGILIGVLPGQRGISWEGHLFGFLAGVFAARVLARRSAKKPRGAA